MKSKIVFITGISSGLGKATASAFLQQGDCVIGTVRDENATQDLQQKYPQNLKILKLDLKFIAQIDQLPQALKNLDITSVDVLINNAGIALAAPFEHQPFSEVEDMFVINVLALMKITQVLLPWIKKSQGRMINISSVSGVSGTPFLASYCSSKHAVEGFSESLRRELNIYGIKVIVVGPGSVKTPIWDKGIQKIKDEYLQSEYKLAYQKFLDFAQNELGNALECESVVRTILQAAQSTSPQIRYAPVPNPWFHRIMNLLPRKWVDLLMIKALNLKK